MSGSWSFVPKPYSIDKIFTLLNFSTDILPVISDLEAAV